jgi:hypothetical protein
MLDTADTRTYSIKPEDYPRLPLFKPKSTGKCVYLNQVFWLALDNAFSWSVELVLRLRGGH